MLDGQERPRRRCRPPGRSHSAPGAGGNGEPEEEAAADAETSAPRGAGAGAGGPPPLLGTCVRCGAEVAAEAGASGRPGPLLHCGLLGGRCAEGAQGGRAGARYLHCCSLCGEARVLAADLAALGLPDFRCGLAGYRCAGAAGAGGPSGPAPPRPLQSCSACGAAHALDLDLRGLGLDFQCGLLGLRCWRGGREPRPRGERGPGRGAELKAAVLALAGQQRPPAGARPQLEREEVRRDLGLRGGAEERYRDGAVVATRGEKFVTVGAKAPAGPGSELAGIIGSGSRGRLGLGLRKMTREEAERCALSNKERGHLKRRAARARGEREVVVFETKSAARACGRAAGPPAPAR